MSLKTPAIHRRLLVLAPALLPIQASAQVRRTPSQAEGPYYPRAIPADAAWKAAHVDEDWNIARWGEDAEAQARRAARRAEFDAAAKVLAAL